MYYTHTYWIVGGIIMIILAILLILFIVWIAGRGNRGWGMGDGGGGSRRDPMEIARERYARGEITKDQFEEIKRNLTS
jgi:putative membrane protein